MPYSLCLKPGRRSVSIGWWSLPNCGFASNCAGSPRRFSSQNRKMESALPYWNWQKGPICDIILNGWRITRVTQPKRKMLRLEPRCYNWSKAVVSLSPFDAYVSLILTKNTPWVLFIIEPDRVVSLVTSCNHPLPVCPSKWMPESRFYSGVPLWWKMSSLDCGIQ